MKQRERNSLNERKKRMRRDEREKRWMHMLIHLERQVGELRRKTDKAMYRLGKIQCLILRNNKCKLLSRWCLPLHRWCPLLRMITEWWISNLRCLLPNTSTNLPCLSKWCNHQWGIWWIPLKCHHIFSNSNLSSKWEWTITIKCILLRWMNFRCLLKWIRWLWWMNSNPLLLLMGSSKTSNTHLLSNNNSMQTPCLVWTISVHPQWEEDRWVEEWEDHQLEEEWEAHQWVDEWAAHPWEEEGEAHQWEGEWED